MDDILHLSESVERITTWAQVGALAVVFGFILGAYWIRWVGVRSKALVDASAKLEAEQVKNRQLLRDQQIAAINNRIEVATSKAVGVGSSLDKYMVTRDAVEKEIFSRVRLIEQDRVTKSDFAALQSEVKNIDRTMTEVHTKVNMLVKNIMGYGEGNI